MACVSLVTRSSTLRRRRNSVAGDVPVGHGSAEHGVERRRGRRGMGSKLLPRQNGVVPPLVCDPSSSDGIGRLIPAASKPSAMNWSTERSTLLP